MVASPSRLASVKTYRWAQGARKNKDLAQPFGETLEQVSVGGVWQASAVVEALRSSRHPCHGLLEWDNAVAGSRWREHEVRVLANQLEFVVESSGDELPVPVSVSFGPGEGYMASDAVLMDDALRARWLAMALREAQAWRKRYRDLVELVEVFTAIEKQAARLGKARSGKARSGEAGPGRQG